MKIPLPPMRETPEALQALLSAEHDAQTHQRLQALYLLQTQQARTRRQVACLLGVHRETVGRWLAAYARGGLPQMLTIAKAPGKVPRLWQLQRHLALAASGLWRAPGLQNGAQIRPLHLAGEPAGAAAIA